MEFDDTTSSGIWWSTNIAIKDACCELKQDTNCTDKEIACFLKQIAISIEKNSL